MVASIPASRIVSVTPSVQTAGGRGLDLVGLILSESTRVPVGTVKQFGGADSVGAWFGLSSLEYRLAQKYFAGYDGAPVLPAALLFAQYPAAPVAAYIKGGSVAGLTLTELQALTGTITIEVDGAPVVSSAIDLEPATSFSNAAAIITTALNGPVCTYDATWKSFVITSATTGAASTIDFATTNALAAALGLTAAAGATLSQGAIAATPASAMDAIVAQTQNFASFMTAFKPSTDDMVAFAEWNNATKNRYVYVLWDDNQLLTTSDDSTTALGRIRAAEYAATLGLFDPIDGYNKAAVVMGIAASIDFAADNGRVNLAGRSQSGLSVGVADALVSDQLLANGCNFYGAYATAAQGFVFFYNGSVTGPFLWFDTLVNQIWLTNAFQLALMTLLTTVRSIPYNDAGSATIETALQGTIDQAVANGVIRADVTLSSTQVAAINAAAGADVAPTIEARGWYLQVGQATPEVRAARGSPPINFWYADGGSIQKIALNSIEVQ